MTTETAEAPTFASRMLLEHMNNGRNDLAIRIQEEWKGTQDKKNKLQAAIDTNDIVIGIHLQTVRDIVRAMASGEANPALISAAEAERRKENLRAQNRVYKEELNLEL